MRPRLFLVVVVALMLGAGTISAQTCGFDWVNPVPPRADLNRVMERGGVFVAVGANGTIVTSRNGWDWQSQSSGVTADLFGIDWGEAGFTAVGDGVVLNSLDGLEWSERYRDDSVVLHDVEFGDSRFIAVGSGLGGNVLISEDGLTWQEHETGWSEIEFSIVWNGSLFLAFGRSGIFSSPDGYDWTFLGDVQYGAKVSGSAVGDLQRVDTAWDGSQFIWVGGAEVYTAVDPRSWELRYTLTGCEMWTKLLSVVASSSRIVVGGQSACPDPFINPDSRIILSTDGGETWVDDHAARGGGVAGLALGPSRMVAVGGDGDVMVSAYDNSWACPTGACTSEAYADGFYDAAVASTGMVVVGGVGLLEPSQKRVEGGTVAWSFNGDAWEIHEVTTRRLRAVASNGMSFVAVGDEVSATSENGISWTQRDLGYPNRMSSMQWGHGMYVAVGTGGTVLTSVDGRAWSRQPSFTEVDLERVHFSGEIFVAVGADGTVMSSLDGLNWSLPECVCTEGLRGVSSTASKVVAVGEGGGIWTSEDLVTWTRQFAGTHVLLKDVVWNGEALVAVGYATGDPDHSPPTVIASADGVHWAHLRTMGDGLRRVIWTGQEHLAMGDRRTLLRASCLGTLVALDPPKHEMLWSERLHLTVSIPESLGVAVLLTVSSSAPWIAAVPDTVRIPAGSNQVTIPVDGIGLGEDVWITATLPEGLGGNFARAEITVSPPIPDPRRGGGRVP